MPIKVSLQGLFTAYSKQRVATKLLEYEEAGKIVNRLKAACSQRCLIIHSAGTAAGSADHAANGLLCA